MPWIKLTNKGGGILVNADNVTYVTDWTVKDKTGQGVMGARVFFQEATKVADRDLHCVDVLESIKSIEKQLANPPIGAAHQR